MTDEQIMKGLKWCYQVEGSCGDCPYRPDDIKKAKCHDRLGNDVIGLIERQKAEIEILQGQNRSLISEYEIQKNNFIHLQERYDDAHKIVKKTNERFINKCKELKTARAEAIKEFAEKLKAKKTKICTGHGSYDYAVYDYDIDNLVKEMGCGE